MRYDAERRNEGVRAGSTKVYLRFAIRQYTAIDYSNFSRCLSVRNLLGLKPLEPVGARRLELRTSSLSVPHENRNFLPIKHLQNAVNALFRAKRTNSVHDTVQVRRGLSSPITPVNDTPLPKYIGWARQGKRRTRLSAGLLFLCLTCWPPHGHAAAHFHREFGPFPLSTCAGLYAFLRTTSVPALPLWPCQSVKDSVSCATQTRRSTYQEDSACQHPLLFNKHVHSVVHSRPGNSHNSLPRCTGLSKGRGKNE